MMGIIHFKDGFIGAILRGYIVTQCFEIKRVDEMQEDIGEKINRDYEPVFGHPQIFDFENAKIISWLTASIVKKSEIDLSQIEYFTNKEQIINFMNKAYNGEIKWY